MSGICGIVNFDGAPVDPDVLRKMADASAYRGPDGIRYWIDGNVGLAHLALNTTPESLRERQPLLSTDGMVCLTADARVDNRDELISTLTAKGYLQDKDPTDADLILAAYECWGEACSDHIIGDFAFAIWDAPRRKLFCARDPVGVRLLHYCQIGHTLTVASGVGAILAALGTPPPVNDALIRDMLAGEFDRWVHDTAYQAIFRLPPAYHLVVTPSGTWLTRYWTLGAHPGVRYRSDAEYIAHFRELFQRAVRARLRSTGPLAILVSGGLDSSSIACLVDHLVNSANAPLHVRLYSWIFDHTPAADEREYLEAVVKKCSHLEATVIPSDDCWGLREFASDGGYPLDEPEIEVSRSLLLKSLRQAHQDGCRVVMAGNGGDQVLSGYPYQASLTLRDVDLTRTPAELPYFLSYSRRPGWWLLAYAYLRPVIPLGVRKWLARWRYRAGLGAPFTPLYQPSGITLPNVLPPPRLNSQCSQVSYRQLTEGLYSARFVSLDNIATYVGIEWRFPFLDRRIIDFMLTLPPRLRFRDGINKYILRQAMVGILPEEVRQRTRGTHFSELEERGLRENERGRIRKLLEGARIVRASLVDATRLSTAWTSYWQDASYPVRPLIWALCVEAWLRYQEQQGLMDRGKVESVCQPQRKEPEHGFRGVAESYR